MPNKAHILDIGAGSGLFVREARGRGYVTAGLEPSSFLADQAQKEGLPVINGTFPADCPDERYDAVFLTDVIEHIAAPLTMLSAIPNVLKPNGHVFVTTPDVSSLAARVLGDRWWHYRIAHIGYYNKKTLKMIMGRAGMEPVAWKSAKWYFTTRYIAERLSTYMPFIAPITKIASEKTMIPVNLYDSWLGVFKKTKDERDQ